MIGSLAALPSQRTGRLVKQVQVHGNARAPLKVNALFTTKKAKVRFWSLN
jgi:hypothetical protein